MAVNKAIVECGESEETGRGRRLLAQRKGCLAWGGSGHVTGKSGITTARVLSSRFSPRALKRFFNIAIQSRSRGGYRVEANSPRRFVRSRISSCLLVFRCDAAVSANV